MNLTDEQWALLEPLIPIKQRADGKGRPSTPPRPVLDGIFWVLEPGGRTCQSATRPTRLATGISKNGPTMACFRTSSWPWQPTSTSGAASTFQNASLTAPSCRQKKGLLCWENQAWQGDQGHGRYRQHWPSCRPSHGKRFAARSHPC